MRKPIPKSLRKLVYAKYNGHCAYCGCEIPKKGFNVDHLYCLRNYEYTEEFTGIDVHDIKNLMPACGSCNRYKATMDLETFRKQLQKIPDRLKRDVCTYNIAVRYGMVQENREPIKFYFEKAGEEIMIDELIEKFLDMDIVGEDNSVVFTEEAKQLIHEISEESMKASMIVENKDRIDKYGKGMSAEDVYVDMLHKIVDAPTSLHMRMSARMLITVIDQKLQERGD